MTTLYLAANRIFPVVGGVAIPTDLGHLQLVYGAEEIEVQRPLDVINPFSGFWRFSKRHSHDDPEDAFDKNDPTEYAITALDIRDRSAYDVWRILDQVNDAYFNSNIQIPYDMLFNSNSYVNTLLKVVGITTSAYLDAVTPDDVISPSLDPFHFPGVGADALASAATAIDLDLTGFGSVDIIRTGVGNDTLSGMDGNDTLDGGGGDDELHGGDHDDDLAGGKGDDTLHGDDGNDTIDGGGDADQISGGAGDDFIFFDSEDTVIDGGEDRDVGIYVDNGDLTLDLSATNLEVVIGGLGNDTLSADEATQACIAGGEGNDTLNLGSDSGAPTVFWGGIGADTVCFTTGEQQSSAGIMIVTVAGLTEENFKDFTLDRIGVGVGFDWSAIDLVMLNPESIDRIEVDGSTVSVENRSLSLIIGFDETVYATLSYEGTASLGDWNMENARVGTYTAGFLDGAEVQAAAAQIGCVSAIQTKDSEGNIYYAGEALAGIFETENEMVLGPNFTSEWTDDDGMTEMMRELSWISYTPLLDGAFEEHWPDGNPFAAGVHYPSDIGAIDDPDLMGPWFVLGGGFEGNGLLPGAGGYAVDMGSLP